MRFYHGSIATWLSLVSLCGIAKACSTSDEPPCLTIGFLTDSRASKAAFEDAIVALNNNTTSLKFEGIVRGTANEPFAAIVNTQTMVEQYNAFCIVGPPSSALTAPVQGYLQTQDCLQMGYTATAPVLSNKVKYPTFARVVASDKYQAQAMIAFIARHDWEEIAVIYSDSVYGIGGWNLLKEQAEVHRISITSSVRLIETQATKSGAIGIEEPVRNALVALRKSSVKVIVMFVSQDEALQVFETAHQLSMTSSETVWMVSDGVVGSPNSQLRNQLQSFFQSNQAISRQLIRNLFGFYPASIATTSTTTSSNAYLLDAVNSVATLALEVAETKGIRGLFQAQDNLIPALKNLTLEGTTGMVSFDDNLDRANPPGYEITQLVGILEKEHGMHMSPVGEWNPLDASQIVIINSGGDGRITLDAPLRWGLEASIIPPTSRAQSKDCSICRPRENLNIAFLTHGNINEDPFWKRIKKGFQYAAVELTIPAQNIYSRGLSSTDDYTKVVEYFEDVLSKDTKPDFIITSQPNASLLVDQVRLASSYGVPVITINTDEDDAKWLGESVQPFAHLGMNNTHAGEVAATEAINRGAQTKFLCIIRHPALQESKLRCKGVAAVAAVNGLKCEEIIIAAAPISPEAFKTAISYHPDADGIILASSDDIEQITATLASGQYIVGVLNFDAASAEVIEAGHIDFAVSQNEFMQGHIGVMLGALLATAHTRMNQYNYNTGPMIVDANNLRDIKCSLEDNAHCLRDREDASQNKIPVIGVLTHAQTGDAFWEPVFSGIRQAATDSFTLLDMEFSLDVDFGSGNDAINKPVQELITRGVDSVISTRFSQQIADQLNEAGIPFLFFNNKPDNQAFVHLPMYLGYVGQDDYQAAHDLVMHASKGFRPHILLVSRYGTEPLAVKRRLDGARAGAQDAGGDAETLLFATTLGSKIRPEEEFQLIKDAIQADDRINLILTAQYTTSVQCTAAAQQLGRSIPIVTFDTLPITIHQVEHGEIASTVDQMPYMQGYMSVMLSSTFITKRSRVVDPMIATGPYFVTPQSLEEARCAAELSSSCTWWLCERGHFYDQEASTCEICPSGTYQPSDLAVGDASCLSCPLGTYNPNPGSLDVSDCLPAPNGTFVSVTGASKSLPCDEGMICGLASTSNNIENISDYNLYADAEEETDSSLPVALYVLIAVVCVAAMIMALLASGRCIMKEWWPWIEESTKYFDQYTGMIEEEGSDKAFHGGVITITVALAVICYMVYFATTYFTSFEETSSLLPGVVALDGTPLRDMEPVPFKIEMTAIGGVGECSENSVQVESNYAESEVVTSFDLQSGDHCSVSWYINDLLADESTVMFTIHSPGSAEFASAIAWEVSAPSSKVKGETDELNGVILPSDMNNVLKGPKPTFVSIATYHTIYNDKIDGTRLEGAIQQMLYNETGSTGTSENFHKQQGLKIQFKLRWSTQFIVFAKSRYQPVGSFFAELTAVWGWFETALLLITSIVLIRMATKSQFVLSDMSSTGTNGIKDVTTVLPDESGSVVTAFHHHEECRKVPLTLIRTNP